MVVILEIGSLAQTTRSMWITCFGSFLIRGVGKLLVLFNK